MQFDHVDPSTKSFDISDVWDYPEAVINVELAKCQLLCGRCHRDKTAHEARVDVHGTWGMYTNRGCRCAVCRDMFNAYRREWRRQKKLLLK